MGIYLDEAATTKPSPEVISAMMPYLSEKWHNPSSLYSWASDVSKDISKARKTVADFINAEEDEVFFTSGGSESNCWAIQGFVTHRSAIEELPCIITTNIEHHSIMECTAMMNMLPCLVWYVGVDEYGNVDIEELEEALKCMTKETKPSNVLVSIGMANNEIGTIQDIKKLSEIIHSYGAIFHTDAVQAFGHIPIDVEDMGIDILSASGHKIGAPKGIGILYKRNGTEINPLIYGSQMDGMRGGTENVPYIIGMAKAVELIERYAKPDMCQRIAYTRDYFIDKLESIGCKLNGSRENRLPNNINVTLPHGLNGESMLYCMDLCDVYISTGSACNSKSIEPSPVLSAIGLGDDAYNSIRITFPVGITKEEIDEVVSEMDRQIKILVNN
jgi:cysteine desulfurase